VSNGPSDSYIVLRGTTYHYRRRVPSDVQAHTRTRWWKRSLKTGAKRQAEAAARKLASEHDALIARVRGRTPAEQHASLNAVLEDTRDEIIADPADKTALADHDHAAKVAAKIKETMFEAAKRQLAMLSEDERAAIEGTGGLQAFFTGTQDATSSIALDRMTVTLGKAVGADPQKAAELEAVLDVRATRIRKQRRTLAKLGLEPDNDEPDAPNDPRIKTAMLTWFQERKQGVDAVKRHKVAVNRFIELHGNIPVSTITKLMVKDFIKTIENLPDHRKLPASMRGGLTDPDSSIPRVSAPTVERHLISTKALLTFCVEQDWLTANPAAGLRAPKDTRPKAAQRRSFTREERNKVLAQAIEEGGENGDMAWLIRLGAYTGCRLEELAQLARSNVRHVDGIWVVEIDDLDGRNAKTEGSVRQIPLHPAIRDSFITWVHSGKSIRVFASFTAAKDGRYRDSVSGDFARLMDRAGLSDPRLVFHSFRHTLKREMSNARIDPDVRRLILGHAPRDAHDGYDGHSLEAIAEELAELPPLFD
jgi:integrase